MQVWSVGRDGLGGGVLDPLSTERVWHLPPLLWERKQERGATLQGKLPTYSIERRFFMDNLLVRIHLIIVMIR